MQESNNHAEKKKGRLGALQPKRKTEIPSQKNECEQGRYKCWGTLLPYELETRREEGANFQGRWINE